MPALQIVDLEKEFTLHLQGGIGIPVFDRAGLEVERGECVVLHGESGIGKSTLLKLVYGSYKALGGRILIGHDGAVVDLVSAPPRLVLEVRRRTLGYVSQFLRCVPRVAARDVVAEPLLALGIQREEAKARADQVLARLGIPAKLIELPPATFSGGEQQRINIARGFVHRYPVLLLDEPTASLDARNRDLVVDMIREAKAEGAAILGIFHDETVRGALADRVLDVETIRAAA
jgi:alpha-D-ribose 1-methylphosphonate 5-triphosphate synthase subunit PhnL